jgi:hypothetical protein
LATDSKEGAKMKKIALIGAFLLTGLASTTHASVDRAWDLLKKSKGSTKFYPQIVSDLVGEGLYFTSVPYLKEFLTTTSGVKNDEVDKLIDEVITYVGVKQFEVLPTAILQKTKAPVVQYILAKKYFRTGKYNEALRALNGTIPRDHSVKPFALMLEGSALSINKNYSGAIRAYEECVEQSKRALGRTKNENRQRQLSITRDYCIVGVARTQFAAKDHEKANLSYLDLSKESYVWPEILFEEAWNSFYQRDYNRTLGKLVTYNAPVLDFIFNPEVDTLRALTYMELCLWNDARKTVDDFYSRHESQHDAVKKLLSQNGKDYKYYYLLAKSSNDGRVRGNDLLNRMLKTINRDATYIELYDSFQKGRDELEKVRKIRDASFKRILSVNLRESMLLQRNLIGGYVRKQLHLYDSQMGETFQGMSFIKLEILSRMKTQLYSPDANIERGRGDIKNLKRNDKQYFWTFNGEFWADELGDYVFSLKSECE